MNSKTFVKRLTPELVIFLILLAVLYAIYRPVTHGYYLYSDDYWTYLDRNKPIANNDAFRSQAQYAARPLGALFDLMVFRSLRTISDANYARLFSIFLLSLAAFTFYKTVNKYRTFRGQAETFLVTIAVFSLPSFQSNIINLFEINSILALLMSVLAASISIAYLGDKDRASFLLHIIPAGLLLSIAAFTYTHTLTFYWVILGCYLLSVSPVGLHNRFRDHFIVFNLPMLAIGFTYVIYKVFVVPNSSANPISPNVIAMIKGLPMFFSFLEASLGFWFAPIEDADWKLVSNMKLISLSVATIFIGCIYGIRKDMGLVANANLGRYGLVAQKYLMIVVIVILSVTPMLLCIMDEIIMVQLRRLQALQTMCLILVLWSAQHIIAHFFVKYSNAVMTTLLAIVCLVGSLKAHHDVEKIFVEPLSAELSYIKSAIRKGFNNPDMHIHVLLSNRLSQRVNSVGFMSTLQAWVPGMVVALMGDLATEDDSFYKIKDTWVLGYAEDHVTSSTKEEMDKGLISLNRLNALIIDLSAIENYIDPYILAKGTLKSRIFLGRRILTDQYLANDPDINWLDMKGTPISNGDYPGFPKSQAFDGDFSSSRWGGYQTGESIKNNAWIGFDFGPGSEKHIRHIRIRQGGGIQLCVIQQSSDGVTWETVANLTLVIDKNIRAYHLPETKPARFWRLLANENMTAPSAWTIYDVQMAE